MGLVTLMAAANGRYLEFISTLDDPTCGIKDLNRISRAVTDDNRSYRGFNLFDGHDLELFPAILRGQFSISGLENRSLRSFLHGKNTHQVSRRPKRRRKHELIKKVTKTHKYYLTSWGRKVTAMAIKLREMYIIPSLRGIIVR